MSLVTPDYDLSDYPDVYPPSEDTFLFIDALECEIPFLKTLDPQIVAEVGSGSGVVITSLSQVFGTSCMYLSTDINRQACLATSKTAKLNSAALDAFEMDLLSSFRENIFDLILFNPPYVVTDDEEISGKGLNRAWAGGLDGRSATNKLLQELPKLLSSKGVLYCVLLKENKPDEIAKAMCKQQFSSEIVLERKIPGEYLYVYKFFRGNITKV